MTVPTLSRLRAAIADPARLAPVSRAAGVRLTSVEPGEVVATMPELDVLPVPAAVLALADFVLGAAIGTALPVGHRVGTLTLHASLLADTVAGPLTATGVLDHVDGGSGASHAVVRDGSGPVARLTCRCAVLPAPAPPRPAPPPPHGLLRLHHDGDVVRAVADPALANVGSTVQGGILAAVLAVALDATGAGAELDVTYLRPVPADGAEFAAGATPVHAGSRLSVGRADLHDARGRLAAVATATIWAG